jgi:uncharacterized lipoprotein YehR (DUF1307 family)
MKKYLTVVLVIILILGILNFTYADELSDQNYEDSANKLNILGLFSGVGLDEDDLPIYDLEREPTRQEAITMLVRLLGKENVAKNGDWEHPFSDVSDWAQPYVGFAYENSLTKGLNDSTFGSDLKVTEAQYLTFLLRALEYEEGKDFKWNNPYLITEKIGLTKINKNDTVFNRGSIVNLSFKGLQINTKNSESSLLNELYESKTVSLAQIKLTGLENLINDSREEESDNNITRAKLAKYIIENFEIKHNENNINLKDIDGHEFETYMLKLASSKIMPGYPDGTFKPGQEITKAELASFFINLLEYYGDDIELDTKLDLTIEDVSNHDWYKDSMAFALNYGIFELDNNNKVYPNKIASQKHLNENNAKILNSIIEEHKNRELTTFEIVNYLEGNFKTLETSIGTTEFDFNIDKNESISLPYDYWIRVWYEYDYFEGAMDSINYTNDEKDQLRQELKNHQKEIAEALIELLPDKKLYGGYYYAWYRYPVLEVDLQTRRYYSWTNYDKPDYISDLSSYEQTKPSYFRWYDFIDDEL